MREKIHENIFFRENEQKVQNICCHDVWLYPPELEQLETDILTFLFSDVLTRYLIE